MRHKLLYILIIIVLCLLCFILWKPKPHKITFRTSSFSELPGWSTVDTKKSLLAFQKSCKAFLKQDPNQSVGSEFVDLQAKDWHPACMAALSLTRASNKEIKAFFQKWFIPVEFFDRQPVNGLFTGYYMPLLKGSLTKTKKYHVPLYGLPRNLVTINLSLFDPKLKHRTLVGRVKGHQVVPYYTRAEINKGAIKDVAPVIAWVDSTIDRLFLEIQGSGIIEFDDGKQIIVGYDGQNGAPYTAIAKVLIDQGVMTRENASMQQIRHYLEAHPDQINRVLNQNKSFVFFDILQQRAALGTQGVPLTPGYSLAIDRQWVPLGTPVWLSTTRPYQKSDQHKVFQRLMVAQDTGGAIKGVVRGDVFWGAGVQATAIAGKMKNKGQYWLLMPRQALDRLQNK